MSTTSNTGQEVPKAFIRAKIACPVCLKSHIQYQLKSRLVWERDRDIDLQPRQFYWTRKGLEHIHPPLYYMWHCPYCHFTAGHKLYSNPVQNCSISPEKFRAAVQALSGEDYKSIYVLQALSSKIDFETLDFYQSIKLHLLAVYIHSAIESLIHKDAMNIGRYSLRLAWLYRDLDQQTDKQDVWDQLEELHKDIMEYWPTIPINEELALQMAVTAYTTSFDKSTAIETAIDGVNILQLIGRIHIKLKNYKEAMRILQLSGENARREKLLLDEQLKAPRKDGPVLSAEKSGEMVSDSRRLSALSETSVELIETIRKDWLDNETKKAQGIINTHPGKTPVELRSILSSKGFDRRVINRFFPEQKKKKIFGLFGA